MTRPSTGTTFAAGGYGDRDNRFQGGHRSGLIAVAWRDARGTDTDISPHNPDGSVKYSPLAEDGQLRDDMWAFVKQNGMLVPNSNTNEGWHLSAAHSEGDGPSTKPSLDVDDQMIEQDNWPFDTDLTKQDEPFTFTPLETAKPSVRRLRLNLPMVDSNGDLLVETPGGVDAVWTQPLDPSAPDRQFLLISARKRGGRFFYEIEGYDCARLTDIGENKRGKKGTAASLTFKPVPSGVFMGVQDGEYKPIIKALWHGGDMWSSLGTPTPAVFLVTLGSQASGTFTLTFRGRTTATIAYNAAASAVKSALVALDDGFEAADWTVTGSAGGPYTVTTPGGALTGSGASLATPGTFEIEPVTS